MGSYDKYEVEPRKIPWHLIENDLVDSGVLDYKERMARVRAIYFQPCEHTSQASTGSPGEPKEPDEDAVGEPKELDEDVVEDFENKDRSDGTPRFAGWPKLKKWCCFLTSLIVAHLMWQIIHHTSDYHVMCIPPT